jgi:choline dehydrogenase-like flavoprotein
MDMEVESGESRLDSAHWPERITTQVDGRESHIFAPLGCGAGGSSNLYAATLERFERSDVESTAELPHPTGGWPIAWSDMVRYYEEAERLYRVVGTVDPLSPQPQRNLRLPPPASAVDDHFMEGFARAGLHPYRLHVGFGYKPGCGECGGKRCERDCRSDARSVCLAPALRTGRTVLLAECEAIRFEADPRRVEAVICRHEGQLYRLRGRTVVLAAGAYHSPALLPPASAKYTAISSAGSTRASFAASRPCARCCAFRPGSELFCSDEQRSSR